MSLMYAISPLPQLAQTIICRPLHNVSGYEYGTRTKASIAYTSAQRNRALSVRSRKSHHGSDDTEKSAPKHRFTISSLRGMQQPDLSKKLYKLIKTENHAIGAYEAAGREMASIATQLSEWGEATGDDAISDLSDKLGVILSELAEQEDLLAQNLEESRGVLKQIRNTESSVQPSRDHKAKIQDEIQKLKYKDADSPKIVQLEQELVRAEAQSLVAEAQLTNITRQKFKEAYDVHLAATMERAEKQIMLAKYGRRILNLLDDTPIVPGDTHPPFERVEEARQLLQDAEEDLRSWQPNYEPIHSNAGALGTNAMPSHQSAGAPSTTGYEPSTSSQQAQAPMSTHQQETSHHGYSETSQPQQTTMHQGYTEASSLLPQHQQTSLHHGYGETGNAQPQHSLGSSYEDSSVLSSDRGATAGDSTTVGQGQGQVQYFVDGELRHAA